MAKKTTDPESIKEVAELAKSYSVETIQPGVFLVEDWLFIYPKNHKYGERYRNFFGHYTKGKLKEFVDQAHKNRFDLASIYYAKDESLISKRG